MDISAKTIAIYGTHFDPGSKHPAFPKAFLGGEPLAIDSYDDGLINATLPDDITDGSYLLEVLRTKDKHGTFMVTIVATGLQGAKGDPGDTGLKGDTGDTGPKGDKGDTGDTGAAGADDPNMAEKDNLACTTAAFLRLATPSFCPTPPKIIFLTSATYQGGDLGGLAGADSDCSTLAANANLPGTYKAWLSDDDTSAGSRMTHSAGAYIRRDGALIADNWAGLVSGTHYVAIDVDEAGDTLPETDVWTGTNPDGSKSGIACNDWTSIFTIGLTGDSIYSDAGWTNIGAPDCAVLYPLYCVQQ